MAKPQSRFMLCNWPVALTVLLLTLSWALESKACSPSFKATAQASFAGEITPANAVFRFWHYSSDSVSVALIDETGQRIPVAVTSALVPAISFLEAPIYSEVRPFHALNAGKYEIWYRNESKGISQKIPFTIANEVDTLPPSGLQGLRASVESLKVPVGVEASCAAVFEKQKFVVLRFTAPWQNESLVYDVKWMPLIKGHPDLSHQKSILGLRSLADQKFGPKNVRTAGGEAVLLLPQKEFENLKIDDKSIQIELVAIDRAGNKSVASQTRLSSRELLIASKATYPESNWVVPIDESLVVDLQRFREATALERDKGVFDLLLPVEPSPIGEAYENAFQTGILSQEGRPISIRALLAVTPYPVSITIPVNIKGGRVYPLISKFQLQTLLDQLPLSEPRVEKIDIVFGGKMQPAQIASIRVFLEGRPFYYTWSFYKPIDIKAAVR